MDACLTEPGHARYSCGSTLAKQRYKGKPLGKGYSHWRRIKNDMPDRYRLFFQYSGAEMHVIFAWLNDEHHIRKSGDPNDVYTTFARFLANREIPNFLLELLKESFPKSGGI